MEFSVKLDCEPGNRVELLKHRSASLAAFKLFGDYSTSKKDLIGIGPELFAEQWIGNCITASDRNFEDLIMIYFVKILLVVQNG